MANLGADTLLESLDDIENGRAKRIPQDDSKATHVKTLDKEMGEIDFGEPAIRIERLIRGLNPWPSAYTFIDGKVLKIWRAHVEETESSSPENVPGEIVEVRKDEIAVITGQGLLVITELQLAGKKRMPTGAFLLGYQLEEGCILGNR